MLDLDELRHLCSSGQQFQYLYFWGHQPAKDGRITQSCFSQWFAAAFEIDGNVYPTAEHWMMAAKALLFDDDEAHARILQARDPSTAKALGRQVKNFDGGSWINCRRGLVTKGNMAKFQQNPALREHLLSTGDQVLVEASPNDRIWGIGLPAKDDRAKHPDTWRGENLLGFALMDVRTALRT